MPVKVESDLSEAKIEAALRPLIAAANLDDESVTAKSIRIQLEAKLGVDLTSRKLLVGQMIALCGFHCAPHFRENMPYLVPLHIGLAEELPWSALSSFLG